MSHRPDATLDHGGRGTTSTLTGIARPELARPSWPLPPPSLDFDAQCRSAGGEAGGDFYDVFPWGVDRWGVVIGDACGSGEAAAPLAARAQAALRALALVIDDPCLLLTALNGVLYEPDDFSLRFATVTVAALKVRHAAVAVRLARAGHPYPHVVRHDGRIETRQPAGPILGAFEQATFEEERLPLVAGDALVLWTDGVADACGDDDAEDGKLHRAMAANAGRPARRVTAEVLSAARDATASPTDDMTVMVVRCSHVPAT
jgi:serine phosphatase RsbU (regulator of sigma subunit)